MTNIDLKSLFMCTSLPYSVATISSYPSLYLDQEGLVLTEKESLHSCWSGWWKVNSWGSSKEFLF